VLNSIDNFAKVDICAPRELRIVLDHTWTEYGNCVACWSGFPLQGLHCFESRATIGYE
jgi:hypothetical protein